MIKYKCKCGKKKSLRMATLELVEGKVRTKQAKCQCGKYMREIDKCFDGMPTIIRNEKKHSK